MSVVINTNTQSLFAQRALSMNTMSLQRNIERLSTGYRINRASDDAAGLSISEKMTATIRGLDKAAQNAGDGISMLQTSEGALSVIQDNIQRIRELVVQASNGTNGADELTALQSEIVERRNTIDAIADNVKFNGIELLDGTTGNVVLQTGSDNGQTTTISFGDDFSSNGTNANANLNLGNTGAAGAAAAQTLNVIDVTTITANNYTGALLGLDNNLNNISNKRSALGAAQNGLESKVEFLKVASENMSAARSRIRDVDIADESSKLVKNQILQQSAAAMLGQANQSPQVALSLLP